jgi:hypothetical protein
MSSQLAAVLRALVRCGRVNAKHRLRNLWRQREPVAAARAAQAAGLAESAPLAASVAAAKAGLPAYMAGLMKSNTSAQPRCYNSSTSKSQDGTAQVQAHVRCLLGFVTLLLWLS